MDDALLEGDVNLVMQTPPTGSKDLAVLQAIIADVNCDVSTQTVNRRSDSCFTQSISLEDELNQGINKRISHKRSSRSNKSSFRLFIVPDDPESDAFRDSGLRLSFDEEHHGNNAKSLRFSVTSNEWDEENETPEPLHDYKNIEKNKRSRNTFKQNERSRKGGDTASSVSFENINCDATIDHHLLHSTNPSVLAWLRLKNFEEREKRKLKKQEKKELRRHTYDEAEKKQRRIKESEKRFAQWLTARKKEARHAWREKRARKRVDIAEKEDTIGKDNDPPPNYTVVPTFKGVQAWAGEEVSLNIDRTSKNTSRNSTDNELHTTNDTVNRHETGNVLKYQDSITEPSQLLEAQLKTDNQEPINGNIAENNSSDQACLDKGNGENYNTRPATADSRLLAVSGRSSKLSKRNTQEKWEEQENNNRRPSTSAGRLTSNTDTMVDKEIKGTTHEAWVVEKRKERKSKRPTTAQASHVDSEGGKKPNKKSITFEAWKAQKRQETKEKAKEKKREDVDDALTEAIIKMARKRVESSCNEKKKLDTGMPKWRAKNRVRSSSGEKNASIPNASPSKYAVIQLLRNENDEQGTDSQLNKVATIRKSCENLKLD